MREWATIMAVAMHEPEKLESILKPPREPMKDTIKRAATDPEAWETDQWWTESQ